jgi:hypothetical protein
MTWADECSSADTCDLYWNNYDAEDNCYYGYSGLSACYQISLWDWNGYEAEVDTELWYWYGNVTADCPFCSQMSVYFADIESSCDCSGPTDDTCHDELCDSTWTYADGTHDAGNYFCTSALWYLNWCDGDSTTPADIQTTINEWRAATSADTCDWTPTCDSSNYDDLVSAFEEACEYDPTWENSNYFDYFQNVCADTTCQGAWMQIQYALNGCTDAWADQGIMMVVGAAHMAMAHCPMDGTNCNWAHIIDAIDTYDNDCMCGELDYYLGNATAFDEASATSAYGDAMKACMDGVCASKADSVGNCIEVQSTLLACAYPLSVAYPLQTAVNLPIIQSCNTEYENPCDDAHITNLLMTFGGKCGADAATAHGALCDMSNIGCQKAANALYFCSETASFDNMVAIGMIAQSQMNCMIPDWSPDVCNSGLAATLTTFMTGCDKCSPDLPMDGCSTQICDATASSACGMGYATLKSCFLQVDVDTMPVQANIVNSIVPLGDYCDYTAADCTQQIVSLQLQNIQMVCGCTSAADCLAKATDCSLLANPECAMAAQELLVSCGPFASDLSETIQTIFSSAGAALAACGQPTCSNKFYLTGPFQVDPKVDCCDKKTGKGQYGVDGACCLRNAAQPDEKQPNAFIDVTNNNKPCCYVPLTGDKKGTDCPVASGASSTVAGVATLIAAAAALLL